jgi:YggT family protein
MRAAFAVLAFVVFLYLVVLIGRVLVAEPVYTLTEPPLRALRKVIPPLRLGQVSIDLSFMVLFIGVIILQAVLSNLAS